MTLVYEGHFMDRYRNRGGAGKHRDFDPEKAKQFMDKYGSKFRNADEGGDGDGESRVGIHFQFEPTVDTLSIDFIS